MNYAIAMLIIGFYAGVLAIPFIKYLVARNTEQDEETPEAAPRTVAKKPYIMKKRRIRFKPSLRKGGAV